MSEPHALREDRDGILTVTFNRPDKLNAIDEEMREVLWQAAHDLRERDELRTMLVKGRGRYYSSGVDASGGLVPEFEGSGIAARRWYRSSIQSLFDELEAIEKPVVIAAHAPCLGGALEMALSCDFRLAAESASFGLPETRLGLLPGSGGTSRLTRLVGPAWARWLIMASQTVDARRALMMGLVHDVYPDDEFEERTWAFCQTLVALPPETVGLAKLAIELVEDLERAQGRNIERLANTYLFMSDEHRERMEAFLNRKKK